MPASALKGMLFSDVRSDMTTSEGERDAEPKFGASLAPEALATKAE